MELTGAQGRVVDHAGGRLRVLGGAGSGKTTALLARYRRLVTGGAGPSSVLVLCRSRAAATRFRDAVLPHLAGAFDALPITTFFGLAYDLVSRHSHSGPVTLLTGPEQRHVGARMLAAEDPDDWPTLGHLLGRAALVGEVADGLLHLHAGGVGGTGLPPWPELAAFAGRYREALDAEGRVDASSLLARAAGLLADPTVSAAERARITHVLVDDYETATPAMALILDRLAGGDGSGPDGPGGPFRPASESGPDEAGVGATGGGAGPDGAEFEAGPGAAGREAAPDGAGFEAGPGAAGREAAPNGAGLEAGPGATGGGAGPDGAGFEAGPGATAQGAAGEAGPYKAGPNEAGGGVGPGGTGGGRGHDVVVAGDPDGATGGFPGADRRHLTGFQADVEVDLGSHRFRQPDPPVLVSTRHPSLEPEAVAGELLAARAAGVAWSDMAVLVRRPRRRAAAIARALARHGIPARAPAIAVAGDDPVVDSVVHLLRWVDGDDDALDRLLVSPLTDLDAVEAHRLRREARIAGTRLDDVPRLAPLVALRDHLAARAATDTPAELAFQIWQQALGHLVVHDDPNGDAPASDVLDGLVAFLDALRREAERNPHHRLADVLAILDDTGVEPDPWRVDAATAGSGAESVTVTSILAAAGREWHTVVVAGCVEGELPALGRRSRLFDADPGAGRTPPPPADRRRMVLAEERRLFALACSRATSRLVAAAGPEPGVLLSRFVEGWEPAPIRTPLPPGRAPTFRRPTVNPLPIVTDAGLTLSATQLATYDDCPLRYAYRYGLRVRDEGGVRADLGTLVHEVLARFLDPATAGERPRDRETLLAMSEEMWRNDIARYRPQVDEARRDFFAMLDTWWQFEGQGELAPDVLAVERSFDIPVGDIGEGDIPVGDIPVGDTGHRLRGSIDRIDRVERADGSLGIRIVDYKTGKSEPRPGEIDDNIQLAVYHLAATRDPALAAYGPVVQLRLLFLRTMHAYDQEVTAGHAEATEKRILDVAGRIRAEDFEPSVDATCRWCSYQRLCPVQPEGREVVSSWP